MNSPRKRNRPGVVFLEDGRLEFALWAPRLNGVNLHLISPEDRLVPMRSAGGGYFVASVDRVGAGARYLFRTEDGLDRPDPVSHSQPDGVHRASEVVDHSAFNWTDGAWTGIPLSDMVVYEIHVGAFTEEGTFEAAGRRLPELAHMGVNAVELMPVSVFPGDRNWGYDGVHPFAVQASYGGPQGLKSFVDAAHSMGIAVVLDVVYNHLGPEGNYLGEFGPYFTERYLSPWGAALNFDGALSDDVRLYFTENAAHWFENYHIDALRLDAVHGIYDMSAFPFLAELSERAEACGKARGREALLIAESDSNDVRALTPRESCGFGLSGQWSDDFHHALHALLTGERSGYYRDFGRARHLEKALRGGTVYSGQYSPYRQRRHGNSFAGQSRRRLVVFSQNHDQVGNRMKGERLSRLVSFESLKLAASAVLLSPFVPLLFMGEEYGEESPFLYFVSHSDEGLISAVRDGRKKEFEAFGWDEDPPDPQSRDTFAASKLSWEKRNEGPGGILLSFYRELLRLRKSVPALSAASDDFFEAFSSETPKRVCFERRSKNSRAACILTFGGEGEELVFPFAGAGWRKAVDSADVTWKGPGSKAPEFVDSGDAVKTPPNSAVLYVREGA